MATEILTKYWKSLKHPLLQTSLYFLFPWPLESQTEIAKAPLVVNKLPPTEKKKLWTSTSPQNRVFWFPCRPRESLNPPKRFYLFSSSANSPIQRTLPRRALELSRPNLQGLGDRQPSFWRSTTRRRNQRMPPFAYFKVWSEWQCWRMIWCRALVPR